MKRTRLTSAPLLGLALTACASSADRGCGPLAELSVAMTGTFPSGAQHLAALDDYCDLRLVMVSVRTERPDGPWLYVEQAVADTA